MSVLHYRLVQDTLHEYKSNDGVLDVESALAFGRRITAEANIQKLALLFKERGINIYYVGGCVRDKLLNVISNDIDIAVEFGTFQDILDIVSSFASHITEETVGNQFAVVKATIDGQEFDFSLCRGEVKTGDKHSDFLLDFKATIIEDLRRRDITINAIAQCPLTGAFIDPFGGREDLVNKVAREVSKAFAEDPLRVLRVARFIARYNLTPTQSLIDMCTSLDWSTISRERIGGEVYKVFKQAAKPSLFFEYLNLVGWLQPIFTELHDLIGVEQNPKHHPEICSYQHVLHTIDAAEDVFTRVVMLCHDLGKATTAKINPKTGYNSFHGHETASTPLAKKLMKRIAIESIEGFGSKKVKKVIVLSELHMLHTLTSISDAKLAERVNILHQNNLEFNDLVKVMRADESERPPIVPDFTFINSLVQRVDAMVEQGRFIPIVTSEKLFALGAKQSLELGTILKEGFRLQLMGELTEENWINMLGIKKRKIRWDMENSK